MEINNAMPSLCGSAEASQTYYLRFGTHPDECIDCRVRELINTDEFSVPKSNSGPRTEFSTADLTSTYFEADPPFAEGDKRRHG